MIRIIKEYTLKKNLITWTNFDGFMQTLISSKIRININLTNVIGKGILLKNVFSNKRIGITKKYDRVMKKLSIKIILLVLLSFRLFDF